MVMQNPHYY